jgi:hypothetical protein
MTAELRLLAFLAPLADIPLQLRPDGEQRFVAHQYPG